LIYSVSYIARSKQIDRIVALDEFDMENVSALREAPAHSRHGPSRPWRYFRDKNCDARAGKGGGHGRARVCPRSKPTTIFKSYDARAGAWLLSRGSQASGIA